MSIPIQISKGLVDKSYDKRKISALQLEGYLKELLVTDQKDPITYILLELSEEYLSSTKESTRAGAIMGLATCGIALGSEFIVDYLDLIVPPILSTLADTEPKIRYYGCEALYNIAKVGRGLILGYFNQIMDMLSRVTADPVPSVKESANYVDRLIKDIVTEETTSYLSIQALRQQQLVPPSPGNPTKKYVFSLETFIPLLSERMHTFKAATRLYLIEWIRVLDSVPGLDLIQFLPSFLDQLIRFLSDPKSDVRLKASNALSELLREVEEVAGVQELVEELWHDPQSDYATKDSSTGNPDTSIKNTSRRLSSINYSEFNTVGNASKELTMAARRKKIRKERRDFSGNSLNLAAPDNIGFGNYNKEIYVDHAACLGILIIHLHSNDQEILATALNWVGSFTYVTPSVVVGMTPQLIHALLPLSSHTVSDICTMALRINKRLQELICYERSSSTYSTKYSSTLFSPVRHVNQGVQHGLPPNALGVSNDGFTVLDNMDSAEANDIRLSTCEQVVTVIMILFENNVNESTKVEGLKWLLLLQKFSQSGALSPGGIGFPFLLKALSDGSDNVVKLVLRLFAQIALSPTKPGNGLVSLTQNTIPYISKFISNLLQTFLNNRELIQTRMPLIVRQLCLVLDSEQVFRIFSYHLHLFLVSRQLCPSNLSPAAQISSDTNFLVPAGTKRARKSTSNSEFLDSTHNLDEIKSNKSDIDFSDSKNSFANNLSSSTSFDDLAFAQGLVKQLTWILACAKETTALRIDLPAKNSLVANIHEMLSFDVSRRNQSLSKSQTNTMRSRKAFSSRASSTPTQKIPKINSQAYGMQSKSPENADDSSVKNSPKINQLSLSVKKMNLDTASSALKSPGHRNGTELSKSPKNRPNPSRLSNIIASEIEPKNSLVSGNQGMPRHSIASEPTLSQLDSKPASGSTMASDLKVQISPNMAQPAKPSKILNRLSRVAKTSRTSLNYSPTLNFNPSNKKSTGSIAAAVRSESPLTVYPILPPSVSKTISKNSHLSETIDKQASIKTTSELCQINEFPPDDNLPNGLDTSTLKNIPDIKAELQPLGYEARTSQSNMAISPSLSDFEVITSDELLIFKSEMLNNSLFEALFCSWSCSPVSTLILCFLAQQYELSYNIIVSISSCEINLPLLKELDQLVQLLESPVFSFLRVQLLNQQKYPYLTASMYGILMILPQSVAFVMLKNRLNSVVNIPVFNQGLIQTSNNHSSHTQNHAQESENRSKSHNQRNTTGKNSSELTSSHSYQPAAGPGFGHGNESELHYRREKPTHCASQQTLYEYYSYSQTQISALGDQDLQNSDG